MMRSMWTAATGMKAQQFNIDTISHNLSNVNTTGFKGNRAEFQDLFYANIKRQNVIDGEGRPINLEVGHGVMPSATRRNFGEGSFMHTEGSFDFALNGEGFFGITLPNGDEVYTRDGSFKLSIDGEEATIVTSDGYFVHGEGGEYITFDSGLTDISVDQAGFITGKEVDGGEIVDIGKIDLYRFLNPEGLEARGQNLFRETNASGEAAPIEEEEMNTQIVQGYLEMSNVQVVDEMVNMITAQRAYEINSKAITTSDEMLQIANNLKR